MNDSLNDLSANSSFTTKEYEHFWRSMFTLLGEENPYREGLKDTPDRILRSWMEIFSGYKSCPEDIFRFFEEGKDCYNQQIVLLKNIEFSSTCEHHFLPFSGMAHVGYLPSSRVVGLSKLARVVDMYARRLQMQERIAQQVCQTLMDFLRPAGAVCILEASHHCLRCRGAQKSQASMVTAEFTGVFREDEFRRKELLSLLRLS